MFSGNENHFISLNEAEKLTKKFRTVLSPLLGNAKGEYFGKDAILALLNQEGAVGLRIYFGLSNDLVPLPKQVLVAVSADGNDLINGLIVENGLLCPPACSAPNVLNGLI